MRAHFETLARPGWQDALTSVVLSGWLVGDGQLSEPVVGEVIAV